MTASGQAPDPDSASFEARRGALLEGLASRGRVAVAFSGGVDSSVLLHAAHAVLGDGALGVIADSPSLPRSELEEARRVAADIGARLVEVKTSELSDPRYNKNDADRCYFCKHALFDAMVEVARREGIEHLAFGKIRDDALDDRPGERAATELGVLAPLDAAGFSKEDVRRYAREAGIAVAEKPASACLASRIPRGTEVTAERLRTVEAAEARLRELGLSELRVRHRGQHARVELGPREWAAWGRAPQGQEQLAEELSPFGFRTVELAPYVAPGTGSSASATS